MRRKKFTIDLSEAYREGIDYLGDATIRDVAARSGLGRETVHQISRNKGDPKLSTLIAIADAFDLTVVQFLELSIVPESESELEPEDPDRNTGRNRKGKSKGV